MQATSTTTARGGPLLLEGKNGSFPSSLPWFVVTDEYLEKHRSFSTADFHSELHLSRRARFANGKTATGDPSVASLQQNGFRVTVGLKLLSRFGRSPGGLLWTKPEPRLWQ